jgi:hypothetical protein
VKTTAASTLPRPGSRHHLAPPPTSLPPPPHLVHRHIFPSPSSSHSQYSSEQRVTGGVSARRRKSPTCRSGRSRLRDRAECSLSSGAVFSQNVEESQTCTEDREPRGYRASSTGIRVLSQRDAFGTKGCGCTATITRLLCDAQALIRCLASVPIHETHHATYMRGHVIKVWWTRISRMGIQASLQVVPINRS